MSLVSKLERSEEDPMKNVSDTKNVRPIAKTEEDVRVDLARVAAAVDRASRKVAPLWPLDHFVAVNPFLGLADKPFAEAARTMGRVAGARMVMPRSFYLEALDQGRVTDEDLEAALAEASASAVASLPGDAAALRAEARRTPEAKPSLVPTVADVASEVTGQDLSAFVAERVSAWASSYFDVGQASWTSPFRELAPWQAFREEASLDRTPEVAGVRGFRAVITSLPETAPAATAEALERLGVPRASLDHYLHRLLMTVPGWSAWARYLLWEAELHGGTDRGPTVCGGDETKLAELLAVRLAWEVALLETAGDAWRAARPRFAESLAHGAADDALALDLVLQSAFEKAHQRELVAKMAAPKTAPRRGRSAVQAAFCIDVRSEVFRRALESVDAEVETIGFAGFFGFSVEYVPLGRARGGKQCPVLLAPKHVIAETAGTPESERALGEARDVRARAALAWKSFKTSAVACFGFVGPVGLAYARKLVTDSLGLTRPVPAPSAAGFDEATRARFAPTLTPSEDAAGRALGMTPEDRLAMAHGVLGAMSLTRDFGRIVLLAGHGSTTVNNPHATGLDCGACGGHTGEANARIAALVLNDPDVRRGLVEKGLALPEDTWFLAGLHDTTTDEVTLFDEGRAPASHAADVTRLRDRLAAAARIARCERARLLGIEDGPGLDDAVVARSRDWSQVRPEWGLAGCAAFIAAPRAHTQGVNLAGRSFLHSYAWREDQGFGVLELIMTAPMVVASWISLQYYGSTVDNVAFGSGNKALHNVVGTLGVLEGNGGDLRTGLPWQSVHDGTRFVHEPLRLNVMIAAPLDAMNAIVAKHESVRQLLDNGWLHLWALDDAGAVTHRYRGGLVWEPVDAPPELVAAAE